MVIQSYSGILCTKSTQVNIITINLGIKCNIILISDYWHEYTAWCCLLGMLTSFLCLPKAPSTAHFLLCLFLSFILKLFFSGIPKIPTKRKMSIFTPQPVKKERPLISTQKWQWWSSTNELRKWMWSRVIWSYHTLLCQRFGKTKKGFMELWKVLHQCDWQSQPSCVLGPSMKWANYCTLKGEKQWRKQGRRWQKGCSPLRDCQKDFLYRINILHILQEWTQTSNDLQDWNEWHVICFIPIVKFTRRKGK